LEGLSISLANTKTTLNENEEKHVIAIEKVVKGYKNKLTVYKVVGIILLVIISGETTYIIADNI